MRCKNCIQRPHRPAPSTFDGVEIFAPPDEKGWVIGCQSGTITNNHRGTGSRSNIQLLNIRSGVIQGTHSIAVERFSLSPGAKPRQRDQFSHAASTVAISRILTPYRSGRHIDPDSTDVSARVITVQINHQYIKRGLVIFRCDFEIFPEFEGFDSYWSPEQIALNPAKRAFIEHLEGWGAKYSAALDRANNGIANAYEGLDSWRVGADLPVTRDASASGSEYLNRLLGGGAKPALKIQ